MTVLMLALSVGDEELGATFVGLGANIFLSDDHGKRALNVAEKRKLPKSVQLLEAAEVKTFASLKEGLAVEVAAPIRASFRKKPPVP